MFEENKTIVGYSQRSAGANGLLNSADCIGDPNIVAITPNAFNQNCVLYQKDVTTNFLEVVWIMSGTPAAPVWTRQSSSTTGSTTKKVTIPSASILSLNSVPFELLPAPGAGKVIEVLSVQGRVIFNNSAYATHTGLEIVDTSAGGILFADSATLLAATVDKVAQIPITSSGGAPVITPNGSVSATVATGDPTAGDSDLELYITYKINTL